MAGEPKDMQPDIEYSFKLAELSRCCGVSAETILRLVGEGLLTPSGRSEREWAFAASDLGRALCALRLEQDLGVNTAGAALAIELIDEMHRLRRRVDLLESLMFK